MEQNDTQTVRLSITMLQSAHDKIEELSNELGVSMAHIIRLAIEKRLNDYLSSVRYIDKEQGEEIYNISIQIADNSRLILNNIRRIGVNYNQELRLKNAEKKYHDILKEKNIGIAKMTEAKDEYDKAKNDIEATCFNKEELSELLHSFEAITDEMKELVCHIHG